MCRIRRKAISRRTTSKFGKRLKSFASRLAPTGDLCRSQIQCGSEPAREEARTVAEKLKPEQAPHAHRHPAVLYPSAA
ncbi:hypothetical protein F7R05_18815 [Pseudomonas koreensis]|nr:hypothetical protein F7R05_18815 [Pseudomonas koreensis]